MRTPTNLNTFLSVSDTWTAVIGTAVSAGAGLAVLSATFWRREAEPFLARVRDAAGSPAYLAVPRVLLALPLLFPLAVDLVITFSLVGALGLSGGVMGAFMALSMSNAVSFVIAREVRKYHRPADGPDSNPFRPTVGKKVVDSVDYYNTFLFGLIGKKPTGHFKPRNPRCEPCRVRLTPAPVDF